MWDLDNTVYRKCIMALRKAVKKNPKKPQPIHIIQPHPIFNGVTKQVHYSCISLQTQEEFNINNKDTIQLAELHFSTTFQFWPAFLQCFKFNFVLCRVVSKSKINCGQCRHNPCIDPFHPTSSSTKSWMRHTGGQFHCTLLYISCDTRSVGLWKYCLPKVYNGFKSY